MESHSWQNELHLRLKPHSIENFPVTYTQFYLYKKHNKFYQTKILLENSCSEMENTGHYYIWNKKFLFFHTGRKSYSCFPLKP